MEKEDLTEFFEEIIKNILLESKLSKTKLNQIKIDSAKKFGIKKIVKNSQILARVKNKDRDKLISKLNIKPIRELSGVTVVALFAKPHPCPHGKCIYCPGGVGSEFGDTPQSYTGSEPAAMRAIRNNYDPYLQIFNRLEHYIANGHFPDKIEIIFMGGTFPSLEKEYMDDFVFFVYKAINDFGDQFMFLNENKVRKINFDKFNDFFLMDEEFDSKTREIKIIEKILKLKNKDSKQNDKNNFNSQITKNETALIRSIGLTIETKPDWAFEKHCLEMLKYGCTRFEVGVQTLNENCLQKTNRGHSLEDTKTSFQIMKDLCFKINAHMMIGLPASNIKIDEKSLTDLFEKEDFRPDMLKIYPCLVVKGTPLFKMWELGLFKPIETGEAAKVIARSYLLFPRYVRVMRVQRDIPTNLVEGGVQNSNLREFVDREMIRDKIKSCDIRSREIGIRQIGGVKMGEFKIKTQKYSSSGGIDYFIDVADENDTMIGFIRLRFPKKTGYISQINEETALIRELHIYGQTIPVGKEGDGNSNQVQHKGWGSKLLKKAEEIANENGYKNIVIISGVGVREYYRKFGYKLNGPYMVKNLNSTE